MADTNLQKKIEDLSVKMNEAVAASKRRNTVGLVASIIIIVMIAIYLSVAHSKFGSIDPELAGGYTQAMLESYLPEAGNQLEQSLKDKAPEVIDNAEKRLRAMPDTFAARINDETKKHMEEQMPKLEDELYQATKAGLVKAKDEAAKQPGTSDEERFKSLLQGVADIYGEHAIKAIDEFHQHYASGSGQFIDHLNLLAENKSLDKEQSIQRDIVQKFLVLAHHYEAESGKTDQTKTSFGSKDAAIPGTK